MARPDALADRIRSALDGCVQQLLAARNSEGYWSGELSSSALSTATAVTALYLSHARANLEARINKGLAWLANHQNQDGGWGDTVSSISNLSTTTLCWAAFGVVPGADSAYAATLQRVETWIHEHVGSLEPEQLAPAIIDRYGKDRTFSVPILTMCALAGRLGASPEAWRHVIPLPFELAACPHQWFALLRMPVVSYALPALIAMGQARFYHSPPRNPFLRLIRLWTRRRTLRVLTEIQPVNGGFLEATPLTSFVTMSLAASGQAHHVVARRGTQFLESSQREDGSWPIDTNLATWLTTLSLAALPNEDELSANETSLTTPLRQLTELQRLPLRDWLLNQQYRAEHPYTHAAPGGWAWTNLPGGVPDADDTAGAVLALHKLAPDDPEAFTAAKLAIDWLLNLQNADGGIPTFCRGWGHLPFDKSSADITAHTVRAWLAWFPQLNTSEQRKINRGIWRALTFLSRDQRSDGSWLPLWFGNQHSEKNENPTYGTSRILLALVELVMPLKLTSSSSPCERASQVSRHSGELSLKLDLRQLETVAKALERGGQWLVQAQNADGSWGGFSKGAPSIEETALALEALARIAKAQRGECIGTAVATDESIRAGTQWLLDHIESGGIKNPAPIGFYFAQLWYFEKLYPLIFTVGALRAVAELESV